MASDGLNNLTLKINKITDLDELEAFANRKRVFDRLGQENQRLIYLALGVDVRKLPNWTGAERQEIIRRKYEIQKGLL